MSRTGASKFAVLSIAAAVATIALKTLAWWLTGSVGMLSDAIEGTINLAAAAVALAMISVAARPPDEDHAFGYTKAEYFSSGLEGTLILIAASPSDSPRSTASSRRVRSSMSGRGWRSRPPPR